MNISTQEYAITKKVVCVEHINVIIEHFKYTKRKLNSTLNINVKLIFNQDNNITYTLSA